MKNDMRHFEAPKKDMFSQCPDCLKKIKSVDMVLHVRDCTLRKESCEFCGEEMRLMKLEKHRAECSMNPNKKY